MFKGIIHKFSEILHSLNKTPIQRLVIYAIIIYPSIVLYLYKDEFKMLFTPQKTEIEMNNVAMAQERCFNLRNNYNAESVMVYIYQPNNRYKTYKERIVFSTSKYFEPLEQNKRVYLASQSLILEDMKRSNVAIVTKDSKHLMSLMIVPYQLNKIIVTPIRDPMDSRIIGEVVWIFKDDLDVDYKTLYQEGQVFTYNINHI